MKLYVQKPGGWNAQHPNGVFMEKATKVYPSGKTKVYDVYFRIAPDPRIEIDTKHRQPQSPAIQRTGLRVRKEGWMPPSAHVYDPGSVATFQIKTFDCMDCRRKLPVHLESQTQAPMDFLYGVKDLSGNNRRDMVYFSETKLKGEVAYRSGVSFANVCTKCANKRIKGEAIAAPSVSQPVSTVAVATAEPKVKGPRVQTVIEQYARIVTGRHGGSRIALGGHNVIRPEDIEAYNHAILLKRSTARSMKPRIHKAA